MPGFGAHLDCNNVYKDYPAIIPAAGLNGHEPEPDDGGSDDSARQQLITVGPVSSGDALTIMRLCEQLQLTEMGLYRSAWSDTGHTLQELAIGPVSSGDAWLIMRQCAALELTDMGLYRSQYAD